MKRKNLFLLIPQLTVQTAMYDRYDMSGHDYRMTGISSKLLFLFLVLTKVNNNYFVTPIFGVLKYLIYGNFCRKF